MWDGAFSPVFTKHRDYAHASFYEHLVANSVDMPLCSEPVWCDYDPITTKKLFRVARYYILAVRLTNAVYPYLIPEHDGGGEPDDNDIKEAMQAYAKNDVSRDINWFIDFGRGINKDVIQFMWDNNIGDKMDINWTENQTETSARRAS